ncbi:DegT/DnrJ/EryC1/StrS family aminotransferase [Dongia deserti]|uniref:DegT/DnrJ/EryC1/StrS family aminotransferase n=1 Tax=Dongia deserti TaxID=2268030 RepID=UPI000E64E069|nr:DegT/DnrJ/EryC1/StrS family aminotransferase [Dongia deserti]
MNTAAQSAPPVAPPWVGAEGLLPRIAEIAGLPKRRNGGSGFLPAAPAATTRVRYVENKCIDWERVREIAALSERAGQWANFGPVSTALERSLEFILNLPNDRAVIMCASATVGLQALAGLEAAKRGRSLRWAVSAYTFFSQRVGTYAGAMVVDSDDHGLVDLDAIAASPDETWDGLVVTNLFAGLPSARAFADFCCARDKAIIVDSAAALFGPDRTWAGHPNETISFHQTKPWGVGEGGCIIVDRPDATLARSIINFGVGAPLAAQPFAGNGKISDVAAAVILERLERLPSWAARYDAQRRRIESLCSEIGVPLLLQAPREALLASVPALSAQPIKQEDFRSIEFDLGKYYPPLDDSCRTARGIFERIINIPSHCGMSAVETRALVRVLERLLPDASMQEVERS